MIATGALVWSAPTDEPRISGNTFNNPAGHAGVDLWAVTGDPVYAAAPGRVTWAGFELGGYGNLVKIDHGGGWETRYAHLLDFAVAAGSTVAAGDVLGHADTTGRAYGSHLHFEIRTGGTPIDPWPLIAGTRPGAGGTGGAPTLALAGIDLPDPTDIIGGIGDLLGPIRDLIASIPATFLKVLFGGHSLVELVLRMLEIVAGAIVLAVGFVMLLRVVASGGDTGRALAGVRRSTRQVGRQGRRGARQVGRAVTGARERRAPATAELDAAEGAV